MIVVASDNGKQALPLAMAHLCNGATAIEAVEVGIRWVEDNREDHSVGRGGSPNLLGEVELDASIMDGATLRTGAVAAMRGYPHPISVARQVMERLPFVFLVGEGAEQFAAECGFNRSQMLTRERFQDWQARLQRMLSPAQYARLIRGEGLLEATQALIKEVKKGHGTTNLIAVDGEGNIAAGVSTSGLALKFPGRVGDSPMIGAGNFADNRYGAVTCTGYGEMAIRAGTARSVIAYIKMGLSLTEAAAEAMRDLDVLDLPWPGRMNLIAVGPDQTHCGVSGRENDTYVFMTDEMEAPESRRRTVIPLEEGDTG